MIAQLDSLQRLKEVDSNILDEKKRTHILSLGWLVLGTVKLD